MKNDKEYTVKGFIVWGLCAIFFLYEFLLRTVMGTFQHPIMYDLELTTFQFSLLSTTMYLLIYGLMQIPVGLILDHHGLKKTLMIGVITCFISVFGFAYSYQYWTAAGFRMLMGFGSSFGFICLLFSVYDWMPSRNTGLFIGLSQFIGTMGPMLAAGPLETVSQGNGVDWRDVFLCLGAFGIIISIAIFMFVNNNKEQAGEYVILYRPEKVSTSLKRLFIRIQPWYIAIFSACVYFSIEYLSENEGKSFLEAKGYSSGFAAYMITLSWLGYAIGCPLLGFLSDYFQRRKSIVIFAALCCTIAIATIVFVSDQYALIAAFFLLGIGASGQSVGFLLIAEQFQKKYLAMGLSLNNMAVTTIASLNAPALGWILDKVQDGDKLTLANYHQAFAFMVGFVAISIIVSILAIKETFCKSAMDFTYLNRR
jgi:MFS family permease